MIMLKGPEEIEIMRRANVIVAEVLAELRQALKPGVTTGDLDRIAEELTIKKGAVPAFKGYTVAGACLSGVPLRVDQRRGRARHPLGTRVLREGDIIGLDFGVIYQGYYGDAAVTVGVGAVT